MSRLELLNEIERLRAEMNGLANAGIEYEMLLEVSRKLDVLIVKWYKGKYLN
ncbi:MAG: aspartyl-phosphate phosphatase Spo0E family protein [Desulfotomaculaceae bacterium]|nr:aspartyl-phosphate phosphatase Spo0E family protein [Desulfotomaculaceae bacterium]